MMTEELPRVFICTLVSSAKGFSYKGTGIGTRCISHSEWSSNMASSEVKNCLMVYSLRPLSCIAVTPSAWKEANAKVFAGLEFYPLTSGGMNPGSLDLKGEVSTACAKGPHLLPQSWISRTITCMYSSHLRGDKESQCVSVGCTLPLDRDAHPDLQMHTWLKPELSLLSLKIKFLSPNKSNIFILIFIPCMGL